MKAIRSFVNQVATSAVWPSYIALIGVATRVAPWPREIARPVSFAILVMALTAFLAALAKFLLAPGGWAEEALRMPPAAARQARRTCWFLLIAMLALLLPDWLFQRGLIAHGDRPVTAPTMSRALGLAYETVVLITTAWLFRAASPLVLWLGGGEDLNGFGRHRRIVALAALAFIGTVMVLDVQGFGYTAKKISSAGIQSLLLVAGGFATYRLLGGIIDHHAWKWWRHDQAVAVGAAAPGTPVASDDLARKLRKLAALVVPVVFAGIAAWTWSLNLILFKSFASQTLWPSASPVTMGEGLQALAMFGVTLALWRHMGEIFTLVVFPRMADDPGVRFAVLTLCRYLVLGVGLLAGMTTIHLGPDKIGVGLAALGVGLGFGLQEIVSNFVSGIILLLERPIRVGDIVTVSGMSGKVERINIRATTIINADNQSLIVPNREFITSNLVNWTHNDRILRVNIEVGVVYGTDLDKVSDLLLAIARNDADVLRNPVPMAMMEGFGESSIKFGLHVHVPDPSVAPRTKHRLCGEIQRKFEEAGISIPFPTRELVFKNPEALVPAVWPNTSYRGDHASDTPPGPLLMNRPHMPVPAEPSHRGVDE